MVYTVRVQTVRGGEYDSGNGNCDDNDFYYYATVFQVGNRKMS